MSPDQAPESAGPAEPVSPAEPATSAAAEPDPAEAARSALARARRLARSKGLRPGMKPAKRRRTIEPTLSGSGTDGRDPALIGDQLGQLLAERGWHADVAVGSVLGRWPEIVGPNVAEHVRPVTYEAGVLTVQADSTAWATEIRLLTSRLLGRIEQEAGPGTVSDLVVLGPAAPRWHRGSRRVAGRGPRDTYG